MRTYACSVHTCMCAHVCPMRILSRAFPHLRCRPGQSHVHWVQVWETGTAGKHRSMQGGGGGGGGDDDDDADDDDDDDDGAQSKCRVDVQGLCHVKTYTHSSAFRASVLHAFMCRVRACSGACQMSSSRAYICVLSLNICLSFCQGHTCVCALVCILWPVPLSLSCLSCLGLCP